MYVCVQCTVWYGIALSDAVRCCLVWYGMVHTVSFVGCLGSCFEAFTKSLQAPGGAALQDVLPGLKYLSQNG